MSRHADDAVAGDRVAGSEDPYDHVWRVEDIRARQQESTRHVPPPSEARIGPLTRESVPTLTAMLSHEEPGVREAGLEAAALPETGEHVADAEAGTWVYFSRLRFLTARIVGIGQVMETGLWSGDLVLYVAGGSVHQPTAGGDHTVAVTDRSLVGILRTAVDALRGLIHPDPRVREGAREALGDLPLEDGLPGGRRQRTISRA